MTHRAPRWGLVVLLLLAPAWSAVADDTLVAAYTAILRGDYDTGRATIDRILEHGPNDTASRVQGWLESYHAAVSQRNDIKQQTHEWNLAEAQKALEAGNKFLALNFVARSAPYARDLAALSQLDWVRALTQEARATAGELETQDRWTNALNYYMVLSVIYPDDDELERRSEEATRHARIELSYKDDKALKERIRGVNRELLRDAIRTVGHLYYQSPDFKTMALGGLDNLVTLANTTKLRAYLDGLANPALREHFVRKLGELRQQVAAEKTYTDKDLLKLFNSISDANRESIELPDGLLIVEYVEGVLGELDDYTSMIWPADAVDFEKMMMGDFDGVGIQLGLDELTGRLKVVTPLENSPALRAGVQPGDLIVAVDGESTVKWTTDDAVRNIMGPKGTEVVLTLKRPATGEELVVPLVRDEIKLVTVKGVDRLPQDPQKWNYMLDKDTGVAYIQLRGFQPNSADELRQALALAEQQGMRGLVLDVRHNPGGLLEVAVEIVSTFLDKGDVVSTRGRLEAERRERVDGKAVYKDLPLVVLVNEGSASASEILAGALQDHHRAIVLGERTFGKGSVQHVRPLSAEARLKLTTALYYLPSGRTPHKAPHAEKWGVDPDWKLELTPKEFRRVIEGQQARDVIHNEAPDTATKELSAEEREKLIAEAKAEEKKEEQDNPPLLSEAEIKLLEGDPNKAPERDPQLETALLLIRVKLAAGVPWPPELAAALRPE